MSEVIRAALEKMAGTVITMPEFTDNRPEEPAPEWLMGNEALYALSLFGPNESFIVTTILELQREIVRHIQQKIKTYGVDFWGNFKETDYVRFVLTVPERRKGEQNEIVTACVLAVYHRDPSDEENYIRFHQVALVIDEKTKKFTGERCQIRDLRLVVDNTKMTEEKDTDDEHDMLEDDYYDFLGMHVRTIPLESRSGRMPVYENQNDSEGIVVRWGPDNFIVEWEPFQARSTHLYSEEQIFIGYSR